MSDKKKPRFVTYEAENCDYNFFDTIEEAFKYLNDADYSEGFSTEVMEGENFIAEITHRSKFTETENRESYHVHTDMCPVDCELEEWPYPDFDYIGEVSYEPVESEPLQTDAIENILSNFAIDDERIKAFEQLEALKARAK